MRRSILAGFLLALAAGSAIHAQAPSIGQQFPPAAPLAPQPVQPVQPDAATQLAIDTSVIAAKGWLQLVDLGKYGESWDAAAPTMRMVMDRNEWIQTLTAMRKNLGSVQNREMADARMGTDPQGVPRGSYIVFLFNTTFSSGHAASEILTMQRGKDGVWRALTYLLSQTK